eukprot:CAMPEP_0119060998 /NCGR_PEP_ID=MMETSP1178-20130426/4878_1 /TAXON_ID=33656 /ORGANISM="unid sp, Strain CCMP2000" /LENGTH=73 /DNA_ID=CAMNT_0007042163 /DNA_START=73 /DNA_END=290 /DNA_ORIENTATION=+
MARTRMFGQGSFQARGCHGRRKGLPRGVAPSLEVDARAAGPRSEVDATVRAVHDVGRERGEEELTAAHVHAAG